MHLRSLILLTFSTTPAAWAGGRGRSAIAIFETDSQVSQISGSGVEGKNTGRLMEVLSNFKGGGVIQSPEFRSSGVRGLRGTAESRVPESGLS